MKKKAAAFLLATGLVLLVCLGWWSRYPIAEQRLCKEFLTALYTSEAERYEQMQTAMDTPADVRSGVDVSPAPQEATAPYQTLYGPMMNEKGLEMLFSTGDFAMADRYAAEKQAALTVQSVSLTDVGSTAELPQFRYRVELLVTLATNDQTSLIAEGVLSVARKGDVPLIDTFKPYDRALLR